QMPGGISFFPDGRTLATSTGKSVNLWDVPTHQLRLTLACPNTQWFYPAAISPDGRSLVTWDSRGRLTLWDSMTGEERASYRPPGHEYGMYFSPDGDKIGAIGSPGYSWADELFSKLHIPQVFYRVPANRVAIVFDAATGEEYARVPCGDSHVLFVDE